MRLYIHALILILLTLSSAAYGAEWVLYKTAYMTGDGYDIPASYMDRQSLEYPAKGIVKAWEKTVSRNEVHSVRSLVEIDCPGYRIRVLEVYIDEHPAKSMVTGWIDIRSEFNQIRYDAWCAKLID